MKRIFAWFSIKRILAILFMVVLMAAVAVFSYQTGAQQKFRKGQRIYSDWGKSFEYEATVSKDGTDEKETVKVTVDKLFLTATDLKQPDESFPYVYTATFSGKVDPKYSGQEIEIMITQNTIGMRSEFHFSTIIGEDGTFSIEITVERPGPVQFIIPAYIIINQP